MTLLQSRYNSQCKLSQQDLLDISEEITQTYAPHDSHHQPELVLLPVDPINLYAYWNLKGCETDMATEHTDKQLALRVYSIPELSEHPSKLQLSFDIKVHGLQNQKQVHLPIAAYAYSAVIGEINKDNSFSALATSNTIHVPRETPVSESIQNDSINTLPINHRQEDSVITAHNNSAAKNCQNDKTNSVQNIHSQENNTAPEVNTEPPRSESLLLKNFNDYGYDLKVYADNNTSEHYSVLSKQDINILMSSNSTQTILKSTSGQGRLL